MMYICNMKHIYLIITVIVAIAMCSCNGGGSGNSRMPRSASGFSDEEKEDIMNRNNPLRQGVTYFHSQAVGYSVQYPNSFVDFKKDGDKGFTCKSRDGYATLKAWGENTSSQLEDLVGTALTIFNNKGASVESTDLGDDSFVIQGEIDGRHFYRRTLMLPGGKCASIQLEYKIESTDDFDSNAIYASLGSELGETLIVGAPPVSAQPVKPTAGVVAQVAYVGEWNTFSTMTSSVDVKNKYPEFKDVNGWDAMTDGKEVYFILATAPDTKITVKNTVTGERLYNRDSRPLIVKCNEDGKPNVEITFITGKGKVVRYVPAHDSIGKPVTTREIQPLR